MPKIDTTLIEGYAEMTAEEKLAALEAYEYEDHSSDVARYKNAMSKANSEAAEWKRKHRELLSAEDAKKQEDEETLNALKTEVEQLRKEKTISQYTAKYIAQGYDEKLALDTAKALADGDIDSVFNNSQKFIEDYSKKIKAENMRNFPKPGADHSTEGIDYSKELDDAKARGDYVAMAYYTRLQHESRLSK